MVPPRLALSAEGELWELPAIFFASTGRIPLAAGMGSANG